MDLLFEQYMERQRRKDRKPCTLTQTKRVFTRYQGWLDEQGISSMQAQPHEVEAYFDQLPLQNSTKRIHLTSIKAAYRYARDRGQVQLDPTYDVWLPVERKIPRVLSMDELRALRDAALRWPAERILFYLFAYTGMRRIETVRLNWHDVDLEHATLDVDGKGNKRRLVPIHPVLEEEIRRAPMRGTPVLQTCFGRPGISEQAVSVKVKKWSEVARVDATPHDFRRTVATSLRENEADRDAVQQLMGWGEDTVMTQHYVRFAPRPLQSAILRLYREDPL